MIEINGLKFGLFNSNEIWDSCEDELRLLAHELGLKVVLIGD